MENKNLTNKQMGISKGILLAIQGWNTLYNVYYSPYPHLVKSVNIDNK